MGTMDHEIRFGDSPVGKAQVTREGLYYHVVCRCSLSGQMMYRLEVSNGERKVDLGILVPEETGFGLETRFPVRRIGEGALSFRVRPRHGGLEGRTFVPLAPEEPFAYLERLKESFLEIQNGKKGISLPGKKTI